MVKAINTTNLETLFRRGFSDEPALDVLIELSDHHTREVLAVNPHLRSTQITKLLKLSGQLAKTKASPGQTTAVLLASRADLTTEHVDLLLKSKNSVVLLALLTPPQKNGVVFTYQMLQELVAHPRFNRWYATTLHGSKFTMDEKVRQQLYYYAYQSYRYNRGRTVSDSFRSNKERLAEIRSQSVAAYPNFTRDKDPSYADAYHTRLLDFPLPEIIKTPSAVVSIPFAEAIQDVIGKEDASFYQLFYSLVSSWTGSLRELVGSTRTLA